MTTKTKKYKSFNEVMEIKPSERPQEPLTGFLVENVGESKNGTRFYQLSSNENKSIALKSDVNGTVDEVEKNEFGQYLYVKNLRIKYTGVHDLQALKNQTVKLANLFAYVQTRANEEQRHNVYLCFNDAQKTISFLSEEHEQEQEATVEELKEALSC